MYDEKTGVFLRKLLPGVRDNGDGSFSRGNTRRHLPAGGAETPETEILRKETIRGRDILTLIRTGPHPLVREGPLPAAPGERLMELSAEGKHRDEGLPPAAGKTLPGKRKREIVITLKGELLPREEWKPLADLPNHRLCRNRIYEIIGDKVLAEIFGPSGVRVLEEEGIPLFADTYARLIYLFADSKLQSLLSQERVFAPEGELALTLIAVSRFRRGVGTVYGIPAVRYGKKHYSARTLSREMKRRYIPLGDRWVRWSALEDLGLGPLECYAGGGPVRPLKLNIRRLLASGAGPEGFWTDFEWKGDPSPGEGEDPLFAHPEFLRSCGISGGLVIPEAGAAARFLWGYLLHLSRKIEDGRLLCLVPRDCFRDILAADPSGAGGRTIPVLFTGEGYSVFSSRLRGAGIGFYEDLPKNPRLLKAPRDILILHRPDQYMEEPAAAGLFGELGKIRTRLTLGILASADEFFFNPAGAGLRKLFGIRDKSGELGKALIRLPGPGVSLPPRAGLSPRRVRRGPEPFAADGQAALPAARFRVEAKFRNLPAPEFGAEQELFFQDGERVPHAPCLSGSGGTADFNHLSTEERDYFLYWRGLCRRSRYLPSDPGYIRLYARELILAMGEGPPEDHFRELLALWLNYRGDFPGLDGFLPQWLLDFGVLYGIADRCIPELLPLAGESGNPFLRDLFLHRRYIEEDHQVVFTDIRDLLPPDLAEGIFRGSPSGRGPEKQVETALGGIDRYLRRSYGLRFFEFFYPSWAAPVLIRAFDGLGGTGYSAYTAEWIRFYGHKPLEDFLEALVRYILYRLRLESGFDRPGREPPLDPLWKYLAGLELGFPGNKRPPELGPERINLETARVETLRSESDAVRDLLHIDTPEDPGFPGAAPPPLKFSLPERSRTGEKPSLGVFLEKLGKPEREALELILRGEAGQIPGKDPSAALEDLARKNHTMPELLLDNMNETFLGIFKDLLIESREGIPGISAEYAADLAACLFSGET
jgi:hypothetical protein